MPSPTTPCALYASSDVVRPSDSCNNVYEDGNSVREPPRSSDHRDVLRRPRLPIFVHVCAAGVLRAAKFGINAVSVMFKYNQSISDGTSGGQKSCGQCRQPGACRCDGFSMAFWVPPEGSRRRSRDAVAFLVRLLNSIHVLSLFRNIKSLRARRHRAADALGQLAPVTTGALATGLTAQRSRIPHNFAALFCQLQDKDTRYASANARPPRIRRCFAVGIER